jgi:hypothetical protein
MLQLCYGKVKQIFQGLSLDSFSAAGFLSIGDKRLTSGRE